MTHNQDNKQGAAGDGAVEIPAEKPVESGAVSHSDKPVSSEKIDDADLPKGQSDPGGDTTLFGSGDENSSVNEESGTDKALLASTAVEDSVDVIENVERVTEDKPVIDEDSGGDGSASEENSVHDTATKNPIVGNSEGQADPNEEVLVDESDEVDAEVATNQIDNNELVASILKRCISDDLAETEKEREELDSALKEADVWLERQRGLRLALDTLNEFFSKNLKKFEAFDGNLPPKIREGLVSRKEGILLCGRMLNRAQERINKKDSQKDEKCLTEISELQMESLPSDLLNSASDDIEEKVVAFRKARRIDHGKRISDARNRARSAEKVFLSAVERQVLPVIDGLDEGKKIGVSAIKNLANQFPEMTDNLKKWFGVYGFLIKKLESEFEALGLQPRIATPGEPIDYELYDPIDVEEDLQFEDEQVKEMVRRGYVLMGTSGCMDRVVRPGQVVVVKNPPKE